MKRFASNFAILLVLTVAITAVLAMLADAPQRAAEPPADSAAAAESTGALATPTTQAVTTTADDAAASEPAAATTDAKPDHLETSEAPAADAPETAVAGAVAQATLPETGPVELLQWLIIGAGIVATGGMVRGAARDWANGDLTLL